EPPGEVQDLLRVSSINFQQQGDPWFLLSDTAGEVSRKLNSIVDLDIIDKTISNITSEVKKVKTLEEHTRERLQQAESEVSDLAWVPDLCSRVQAISSVQD